MATSRDGHDRSRITYAQALTQIGHLAANFSASGIEPGDRVDLAMVDNIDVVLSILPAGKTAPPPSLSIFERPEVSVQGRRATSA